MLSKISAELLNPLWGSGWFSFVNPALRTGSTTLTHFRGWQLKYKIICKS
jgi:hypothetical protein